MTKAATRTATGDGSRKGERAGARKPQGAAGKMTGDAEVKTAERRAKRAERLAAKAAAGSAGAKTLGRSGGKKAERRASKKMERLGAAKLGAAKRGAAKLGANKLRAEKEEGLSDEQVQRPNAKRSERISAKKAARREAIAAAGALAAGEAAAGVASGPDFLCVGLQKGGTQWLYDQLQGHQDFWMPPYKEIHYFDRDFPYKKISKAAHKFLQKPQRVAKSREGRGDAPVDERGETFFKRVAALEGRPLDLEAYAGLFAPKGAQLSGDVTPGYSTLDDGLIAALAKRFPDVKVCMMLREPVSRLWSQWGMTNAQAEDPYEAMLDYRRFKAFAARPNVVARSFPSEIAGKWSRAFEGRFRVFFLDDVIARPDEARGEILSFLGADPAKPSIVKPDFNRKAKARKAERTPKMQKLMKATFAEERRKCAEMFGGPATRWLDAPY